MVASPLETGSPNLSGHGRVLEVYRGLITMTTPLPILRKRADEALTEFSASSGLDPEEVWNSMAASKEAPKSLTEFIGGDYLWRAFQTLRDAEITVLKGNNFSA